MAFQKRDPLTSEQALAYALRLLNQRDYSQAALTRKIIQRGGLPDEAATIVAKCVDLGLINDTRLAQAITKHQSQGRHQSGRAIQAKLRQKGIPKEIIATTLPQAQASETASAMHQGAKWLAKYSGLPQREQRQKMVAYLYRKGFSSQSITGALKTLFADKNLLE